MREIKFRAWDGLNKTMSYWTINDLCNHTEDSDRPSCFEEWMQYTGLKDKNGKEIYFDDFVEFNNIIYLIIWNKIKIDLLNISTGDIIDIRSNLIIKSNIYENK